MSTGSILSILAYPQYGYHLVCHSGLSLVHCSYLFVGSLHRLLAFISPNPTRSSTPGVNYPQIFTAEQLAGARTSLCLNPRDFPDLSPDTLSCLIPSETATLTLLSQLVRGLVTISQELTGVTQKLISLAEENDALKEELHDQSSQIANLPLPQSPPPQQDLSVLQSAIRDLSHRVTAPAPPLPQAPAPTHQLPPPARPLPTRKGKERAQAPPSPPQTHMRTLNTSSPFTTQSLAKPAGIRNAMLGSSPTHTRPANSAEGRMTSPLSPPAISTLTTPPPPCMPRLPLTPARAARQRSLPSPPHLNKLRVRWPPHSRRGLPPSLVPNYASLLLASPQSPTQTPPL